jgi:hypothetical protein
MVDKVAHYCQNCGSRVSDEKKLTKVVKGKLVLYVCNGCFSSDFKKKVINK